MLQMTYIRPADGFTLIELLVVIAIIAILAALMLPTVGLVRAVAKQAQCGNGQRQVMMAIATYAGEYEGITPPGDAGGLFNAGTERSPYRHWPITLMYEGYLPTDPVVQRYVDSRWGYPFVWKVDLSWPNVLACPAFPSSPNPLHGHTFGLRGSAYAGESAFLTPWDGSAHLARLRQAVPFLADVAVQANPPARGAAVWAHNAVWNGVKVYLVHRGRATTAFPDGHVESLAGQQFTAILVSSVFAP